MFRRMSSDPAKLADFGKDRFLDRELRPVCLSGVEAPLLASLKGSMSAQSPCEQQAALKSGAGAQAFLVNSLSASSVETVAGSAAR